MPMMCSTIFVVFLLYIYIYLIRYIYIYILIRYIYISYSRMVNHTSNEEGRSGLFAVRPGTGKRREPNRSNKEMRNPDVTDVKEETHISNDKMSGAVSAVGRGRGNPRERNISGKQVRNSDVTDLKQEAPITSAVSLKPSEWSRSTAPLPLQGPAGKEIPLSYASALKQGVANHEKRRGKVRSQQPVPSAVRKEIEWKRDHKGEEWREFKLTHVDDKGRLHHGSLVRRACKSVECNKHINYKRY